MRSIAPGKVVLTGAYAVLDGAPAIVAAVDRFAAADSSRDDAAPPAEVRAAFGGAPCPSVDVTALCDADGRKLGLGSSAAAVVAALACRELANQADLRAPMVRRRVFDAARDAHARVQSGGSGVDVAASVHGGVLRYELREPAPVIRPLRWPPSLVLRVFFSSASARTSELRARVARARTAPGRPLMAVDAAMATTATMAADAFERGDGPAFVAFACRYGELLQELGRLAEAPIVPAPLAALSSLATDEGAAFLPSGAGGGDVSVWLGPSAPSDDFRRVAASATIHPLKLALDTVGVRSVSPSP